MQRILTLNAEPNQFVHSVCRILRADWPKIITVLPNLICKQTELGKDELKTRRRGLSNYLRLALTLVDGRRDAATLGVLSESISQNPEILPTLLAGGYIEVIGESERTSSDTRTLEDLARAAAATRAQAAPAAFDSRMNPAQLSESNITMERPVISGQGAGLSNLAAAKLTLTQALNASLGAESGAACQRVMQANSIEDMLLLLPKLSDLVGLYTNKAEGRKLAETVQDLLMR
jgi:hypothetical protein